MDPTTVVSLAASVGQLGQVTAQAASKGVKEGSSRKKLNRGRADLYDISEIVEKNQDVLPSTVSQGLWRRHGQLHSTANTLEAGLNGTKAWRKPLAAFELWRRSDEFEHRAAELKVEAMTKSSEHRGNRSRARGRRNTAFGQGQRPPSIEEHPATHEQIMINHNHSERTLVPSCPTSAEEHQNEETELTDLSIPQRSCQEDCLCQGDVSRHAVATKLDNDNC